jgi:type I restriction enzyme, R subunit
MAIHQEIAFEDAIEHALTGRGWAIGDKKSYDVARGLDPAQLIMFVRATQPKAWQKLVQIRGGDEAAAEVKLLDRVASEIDKRGTIDVLRHGVKEQGVSMRLSYFKPAHGITSELQERYEANCLTVVRQLRYEAMSGNELDLTLFLNGVPVATAELKNPATNQTVRDAIHQYRADRDPKALIFARRAVVHFAVDPDLVFLTTRLAGEDTRFLPFNRGSEDI